MTTDKDTINHRYYASPQKGRDDYWKKMAAPRFRIRTLQALIAEGHHASVIDLGCGNGQLMMELAATPGSRIERLAGADLSSEQIMINRQTRPEVDWRVADLEEQSTPNEWLDQFDVVIASEIIEHLANPASLLLNAARVAKRGIGRLLLSTQSGIVHETERRVGHVRHFEKEDVARLLSDTGWDSIRIWNAGFPFHDLSKWWANRNPDVTMRRFSEQAYGPFEDIVCLLLRLAFKLNSNKRGSQLFAVAQRRNG